MRNFSVFLFLVGTMFGAEAPAGSEDHQLTVLLEFEGQPSHASLSALNTELRHILFASKVGLRLTVLTEPLAGVVNGSLIVFRMKGSCSMSAVPVAALSDERGPLAMTHIVNGEILPFADVECDRVRQSVQRTWGRANPHMHETQYGAALARVMAHEMYHMLARSTNHQSSGLTKEALSSRDLTTGVMLLSGTAREAFAACTGNSR